MKRTGVGGKGQGTECLCRRKWGKCPYLEVLNNRMMNDIIPTFIAFNCLSDQ